MNNQIIKEINNVKHLGLYKAAIKYHMATFMIIVQSFVFMVGLTIVGLCEKNAEQQHKAYVFASIFAIIFAAPILLISIDRAIQLAQLNRIKKRHNIMNHLYFNDQIDQSDKPWMII